MCYNFPMEEFLNYMANLSSVQKAGWLFGWLSIGFLFEQIIPFSEKTYNKTKHNLVNLSFLLMTMVINLLFSLVAIKLVYPFIESHQVGILYLFELPLWAELIIALLILDFSAQFFVHFLLALTIFIAPLFLVTHAV